MPLHQLTLAFTCIFLLTSATFSARAASPETVATADSAAFYHETHLFDGKVSLLIPDAFSLMSDELKSVKYPNAQQIPDVVYTNDKASVNVVFNLKNYPTTAEDLPQIKEVFEKQLMAVKPESFKSEIRTINGHKYVVYEFISQAVDTKIYNMMFLTNVDGKLLMGTFNCTVGLLDEWKPRAQEILMSVKKSK